jgi:predicted transcriptional regulator of viral defense system
MINTKIKASNYIKSLLDQDRYFFTVQSFADQFGLPKAKAYQTLLRLKRAGFISEVEKGKYVTLGLQPERVLANPMFIATKIAHPAYVSFWSALHFFGFTEQVPRTIFVATTHRKPPVRFQGGYEFQYIHLKPAKFFGYHREMMDALPVLIADREKAIVDALDQPRYAGGIVEVFKCLANARQELDQAKLIDYANRFGSKSLGSRLGYLLSRLEIRAEELVISESAVRLDPSRKPSKVWDTRWRINLNVPRRELNPWQES